MKPRHSVWEYGLAAILLAVAFCPRAAHPQQIQSVTLTPAAYGKEAYLLLPRSTALMVLLPSGDTLWIGNIPDTLNVPAGRWLPDCDTVTSAVLVSRLKVGVNAKLLVEYPIRERGAVTLTPNFSVPLPGGERFVVREVYRRKTTCGFGDGLLLVWAVVLAP